MAQRRRAATVRDTLQEPARINRSVARAWECFIGGDAGVAARLRPPIADAWRRSRALGIDPGAARAPEAVSADALAEILTGSELGRAGRRVLDGFAGLLGASRHVIVLADRQGRILYAVGHREVQAGLERINFMPGAGWAEDLVGPNGIGTPLALERAEVVLGAEHYCQGWQPWVCYGAPVRNPEDGETLGVVDVTGPWMQACPEALALTVAIAGAVERELRIDALQVREDLRRRLRELEARWPRDSLLLVGASGAVLDTGRGGEGLHETIGQPLRAVHAALWEAVRAAMAGGPRELRLPIAEEPVPVRIEPLAAGGRSLGAVIALPPRTAGRSHGAGAARYGFEDLIGQDPVFLRALELARLAAADPAAHPVLLTGETGTGKELFAHAIHRAGPRAHGPLVIVNCAALPGELAEAELFGYAPGAFTGAARGGAPGKFEAAHGGTLFLDELDSLAPALQAKLLRVVESGEVTRLGRHDRIEVDVRLIAAAGEDLEAKVARGELRADLYHRLNALEVRLPPLRARRGDIVPLARTLLERECRRRARPVPALTAEAQALLLEYDWPGNVRELRNLCVRWAVTLQGGAVSARDVPQHARSAGAEGLRAAGDALMRRVLEECGGNVSRAAARLGIDRSTLYRRRRRWAGRP